MKYVFHQRAELTEPGDLEYSPGSAVFPKHDSYSYNQYSSWLGGISCSDDDYERDREIPVTDETALSYPPFFRACVLVSQSRAKLKLNLYKKDGDGERQKQEDHPIYKLLNKKPHAWIDPFTFAETLQFHAIRSGNGYAYISRDLDNNPIDLTILDPRHTEPRIVINEADGEEILVYNVTFPDSPVEVNLPYYDVIHIKGLAGDGICGEDIIKIFKGELGLGLVTTEHKLEFYKDGGVGGGVLMFEKGVPKEKRDEITRYWKMVRSGRKAHARIAFLSNNTKFEESSVNARSSQTSEDREFQIAMASAITGVPQHKLGGKRLSSHNSLEEENRAWLDDVLDPWLCKWVIECTRKLLTEEEQEAGYYFEFDVTKYERESLKDMVEAGRVAVNEGLSTLNAWNKRYNFPPVPEDQGGDRLRIPLNIGFADDPHRLEKGKPVDNRIAADQRDAVMNAIENQIRIACRRIGNATQSASKNDQSLSEFVNQFRDRHSEPVMEIMESAKSLCKSFDIAPIPDLIERFENHRPKTTGEASLLGIAIKTNWPEQIKKEILENSNV